MKSFPLSEEIKFLYYALDFAHQIEEGKITLEKFIEMAQIGVIGEIDYSRVYNLWKDFDNQTDPNMCWCSHSKEDHVGQDCKGQWEDQGMPIACCCSLGFEFEKTSTIIYKRIRYLNPMSISTPKFSLFQWILNLWK